MKNSPIEKPGINPLPRKNPNAPIPKTNPVNPILPEIFPEINKVEQPPALPEIQKTQTDRVF